MSFVKKLIPNAFTAANLACGFTVLLSDPAWSPWLIVLGAFLDLFDGALARKLDVTSDFGVQFDSLADLVTFGVAPAYLFALTLDGPLMYFAVLIVLFAAIRLAIFNVSGSETVYFEGLNTPSSAFFYIGLYVFHHQHGVPTWLIIACILLISALNVSQIKMFSFKTLSYDKYSKYLLGITILVGIISASINLNSCLLITMSCYILLSLAYHVLMSKKTSPTV